MKKDNQNNQNIGFVLVYTHKSLESSYSFGPPNSVLVLESFLKKNGVLPKEIITCHFEKIIKREKLGGLFPKTPKKEICFLISVLPPETLEGDINFWAGFWRGIAGIKQFFNSLVIVGGPAVTVSPEFFMKNKLIDIIVLGEAETAIKYLLKAINQKELYPIPGAYVLKNGEYRTFVYGGRRKLLSPGGIYKTQKLILEAKKKSQKKINSKILYF